MTRIRSILASAALVASLFCGACASHPDGTTGFLGTYDDLPVHPEDPSGLRYVAPDDAMLDFDQLLFDEFEVRPLSGSELASADPELARRMAAAFRAQLIEVVDPYYSVVAAPGDGVLRLRCALSDMHFAGEGRAPEDVVSVRFEAEMQDSVTGKRMAAVVRTFDAGDQSAFAALAVGLLDFMNEQHR